MALNDSGRLKEKLKWLANIITIIRVPLTIIFIYKFYDYWTSYKGTNIIELVVLLVAIYLTDLFDGKVARKLNIVSVFGTYLDVYVDLFFIMSSLILFNIFNLIPIWFTLIVVMKFIEFNITSFIVKNYSLGSKIFMSDKLGRAVCGAYYVLPFFVCLLSINHISSYEIVIGVLLVLIGIGTIISSLFRCIVVLTRSVISY